MKKPQNLEELLKYNSLAKSYFNNIPEYVKEEISKRDDKINSFEIMCNYIDKYTEGDN